MMRRDAVWIYSVSQGKMVPSRTKIGDGDVLNLPRAGEGSGLSELQLAHDHSGRRLIKSTLCNIYT